MVRFVPTADPTRESRDVEGECQMPYKNKSPQTHCHLGHVMVGNNVVVRTDGYRRCRECLRRVKREHAKRKYRKACLRTNDTGDGEHGGD